MKSISNYINQTTKIILDYLAQKFDGSSDNEITEIISKFNKAKIPTSKPLISLGIDKISVLPISLNNYLNSDDGSANHQIDMTLSFSIYVPLKLEAPTCYKIFYQLSTALINNNIGIKFSNITCTKPEFLKSNNCFLLTAYSSISVFPQI